MFEFTRLLLKNARSTSSVINDIKEFISDIGFIMTPEISIAICAYPGAIKSATYGLEEMFHLANDICQQNELNNYLKVEIVNLEGLKAHQPYTVVILPPSIQNEYHLAPDSRFTDWLQQQHVNGAVLASACAGAFILCKTHVVQERSITTHWGLAELLLKHFPRANLATSELIIDHGDLITAGGMMSWVDLGLELIKRFTSISIMRQVGKALVIDTAPREQRYYQQFTPSFQHGDQEVLKIQKILHQSVSKQVQISKLAEQHHMTIRTLQRRFSKATGETPLKYMQKLKVQKATEQLENTNATFETITLELGYDNVAAFRKVFVNTIGLTPSEFRKRFTGR